MNDLVDLHLHSIYSDGLLSPCELVAEASQRGLRAISIADHDNVDGIPEALAAGLEHGVEVVSGVELSVVWNDYQDLHLLGYAFDFTNKEFNESLNKFRTFRGSRSQRIVEKINKKLLKEGRQGLEYENVKNLAGGTIGRPHIGQALIGSGYVNNMEEAFKKYLVPCNEPKRFFPVEEAIQLIHSAGGCTVLAHPTFINMDQETLVGFLHQLIAMGLDGLEAYNSGANNDQVDYFITLARRLGLIVTGGSDFHQPQEGGITIGAGRGNLKIPYQCVEEIKMTVGNLEADRSV